MNKGPIGIFDSGVGGTTIWREINKLLPHESTVYVADSTNAPYGELSKDEMRDLSIRITDFLLAQGCKIIVVACNTVTTNAITYLREQYNVPFIGIEPAIKLAALNTRSKIVGVLATKGTLTSELFHKTSGIHANGITVIEQEGEGLVELIETGKLDSEELKSLLHAYVDPMVKSGADSLVLGCTHYPYLIPLLKRIIPSSVNIVDSGPAVARQTKSVLQKNHLLNTSNLKATNVFYTTGDVDVLSAFVKDAKDASVRKLEL
ncbi:glutamate racemase [Zhouia amylolytica]|uniref:Glutamate racemase n=1 Tax=Zhouia amylolytica AD3 TaxID=1286632 RepID=W2UM11_9FLAO|nr:glutamate racemase [Zhouia amylolytica]ETN95053.1 MurI protein [Zhouia amylolytica AD3]